MAATERVPRAPLKQKPSKSPKTSKPTKSRKHTRSHAKSNLEDAEEAGEKDEADVTMIGADEEEAAEERPKAGNGKGKGVEPSQRGKKWDWVSLADSRASDHPAVFTKDGRFFFLPSGNTVLVHSSRTGHVLSTLTLPSPSPSSGSVSAKPSKSTKQAIVALLLHPSNPFQLLAAHADGQLRMWDFLDGVLLRTLQLVEEGRVTHMCGTAALEGGWREAVVVACTEVKKQSEGQAAPKPRSTLYRLHLPSGTKSYIAHLSSVVDHVALSASGEHLTACVGSVAHVFTLPTAASAKAQKGKEPEKVEEGRWKALAAVRCSGKDPITALAWHSEEEWFATGDSIGCITHWYCSASGSLKEDPTTLPKSTHQWHSHPVRALQFTPNGAYLLSAGQEAVLVLWHLSSGKREYAPRLGGAVRWLSVKRASESSLSAEGAGAEEAEEREEQYLLGVEDGTLFWLNAGTLKISHSLAKVKLHLSPSPSSASSSTHAPLPLALHTQTGNLILPSSHPSFLQVYSPRSRALLSEMEVAPSNRVSRPNPDAPELPVARVERAAVSPGGRWLATVDVRPRGSDSDPELSSQGAEEEGRTTLKFWRWDGFGGWELNTRVECPHGGGGVRGLAWMADPDAQGEQGGEGEGGLLATAGGDGTVRLWRLRTPSGGHEPQAQNKSKKKKGEPEEEEWGSWVLRSALSYRGLQPTSCQFSPDGSVLAIAQGSVITLWDPLASLPRRVLPSPGGNRARIEAVEFVGREGRWVAALERRGGEGRGKRGKKGGKEGRRVLVLWDLLSCGVVWEYELGEGSALLQPLRGEEEFVVFTSSSPSAAAHKTSRALVFRPSSATPISTRKLPSSLRAVVRYPPSSGTQSLNAEDTSFVGITQTMDVVHFGSLQAEDKPSPSSQKLPTASSSGPRTLFHEYFATSSSTLSLPAPVQSVPIRVESLSKGDDKMFDGPAYMLPAISTMFDPWMDGFLQRRQAGSSTSGPSVADPSGTAESLPAERQIQQQMKKGKGRADVPPRVVGEKELDEFVRFFGAMEYPSPASASQVPATPRGASNGHGYGNGHAPANGIGTQNGTSHVHTPRKGANGVAPTPLTAGRTTRRTDMVRVRDEGAMDVDLPLVGYGAPLSAAPAAAAVGAGGDGDGVETPGKGGNPRKRGRKSTA